MKYEASLWRVLHILYKWSIGLVVLFSLFGCQQKMGGNGSPVSPELHLHKQRDEQSSASALSEDTEGSVIDSPQYPEDTVVIAAIGDSITYGQGTWDGGYVSRLEARLTAAGHSVLLLRRGVPGEQSAETDARFLREIAGADIVLLMIGLNDVVNPGICESPFSCHVVDHIVSMIDKALISKVIPVVSTITPARVGGEYDWANAQIEFINSKLSLEGARQGVLMVDNYQTVMANGSSALYYDRIHFNAQGYDVLAEQWFNAIEENQLIAQALQQKSK
ncbi:hypothetical protein CSB45_07885 [candidate division KSB3 bacterium]|uniref:SGNH hydrolase-type esterase domain-containing protein n=1 Tax=candidate division KSB3 bacterium TaxID=2044937 RepID=A0A2G6E5S6_9BACT|nr:MAG: hypothetical protein CSB45_07885 [candidate division KSB3 bacterium]PIE29949.1 MAG: hypothetical protein CSA57_06585 [candidate division KSB3 bacterium]